MPVLPVMKFENAPLEIIDGDRGKNYPKQSEFLDWGYCLFLSAKNVTKDGFNFDECQFILKEKDDALRKGKLQFDDVVLTTRGTVGNVAYYSSRIPFENVRINSGMVIIRPDKSNIMPSYLYYYLKSEIFHQQVNLFKSGVAQPQLPISDMKKMSIIIPSLQIQHKIAAILSAYDDLIKNNLRRIKILEEIAQNLYREWFVNFRFPCHESSRFVDSPLGQIPEGWEVDTVENAFAILGGGTPSKKNNEYWNNGNINWYTPSDLTSAKSMFMDKSNNKITKLGLKKSSAKLFPPFSVMMTSRATLGVISINTNDACTNQGFITCIPNERFPMYVLYYWLKENVNNFINHASGATFKEISKGVFKTLEIIVPSKKVAFLFEEILNPMGLEILSLQRKNDILRQTRDLLLPKLISGEVDVSDLDISVPEEVAI